MVKLVQFLDWVVNFPKSDLVPKQVFDFLVIHYNLVDYQVFSTEDNLKRLKAHLNLRCRLASYSPPTNGSK